MKKYKCAAWFQLILFLLFIAVAFISSLYELGSYANYVNGLEDADGAGLVVFAVAAIMLFSVPLSAVFAIVNICCALSLFRKNKPKKGALIWGAIANVFACAGLILLAIFYFNLYPAGLFSKIFYLAVAAFALATIVIDFVSLRKTRENKNVSTQ